MAGDEEMRGELALHAMHSFFWKLKLVWFTNYFRVSCADADGNVIVVEFNDEGKKTSAELVLIQENFLQFEFNLVLSN
jgi:hypothetical protein